MQTCPKCKIVIRGHKTCCPLCQGPLVGQPVDPAFPTLKQPKVGGGLLFKICVFLFAVVEIVMAVINYFTDFHFHVFSVIMFWAVIAIVDIAIAMYYRSNMIKLITIEAYFAVILCMLVDHGSNGTLDWSINWALPSTLLSIWLLTVLIGKIEHLRLNDYVIYLALDLLLALLQLIFVVRGINRVPYMAVASTGAMGILAIFILIFRFGDIKNAFRKYLDL